MSTPIESAPYVYADRNGLVSPPEFAPPSLLALIGREEDEGDWAEIRGFIGSEGCPIRMTSWVMEASRYPVRTAHAMNTPPRYLRRPVDVRAGPGSPGPAAARLPS